MIGQIIIFFAEYAYVLIVGLALCHFLFADITVKKGVFVVGVLSGIIAFVLGRILSQFIISPRPFVVENIAPLFPHDTGNGFPSEHTLLAIVIAYTIFLFSRKLGCVLLGLALIIGIARVVSNVHHSIDILGSIVIGISAIYASCYILLHTAFKKYLPLRKYP